MGLHAGENLRVVLPLTDSSKDSPFKVAVIQTLNPRMVSHLNLKAHLLLISNTSSHFHHKRKY